MPSVQPGTRLAPYEIVSRLGAGGMGEVWQARDTRLDRDVAVKILPHDFAANAQLKIRFEREAKTISQLSHPNICTLFDVGDDFLVSLSIVDRHGKNIASDARLPPHAVHTPRFSPDGTKMVGGSEWDVWTYDLLRGTATRVSAPGTRTNMPAWSSDGSRIYYASERKGPWQVFSRASDASDQERLLSPVESVIPFEVSPDGREISVEVGRKETGADLGIISIDGQLRDLVQGGADETGGRFSPDGKWIVYTSDESGRRELYVRSTRSVPGRWQISTDGGSEARWIKPDEILYLKTGKIMAVSVKTEPTFTVGTPEVLFEHNIAAYDVARDGRILISEALDASQASGQMNVVINWFEDVKSRMR
jgi:hypothetical protein